MFAAETKALVRNTGAQDDLISNCNLNRKMEVLTLVRVRKGAIFQFPTYKAMNVTLPELLGDQDFSPELEEEVLVEDFKTWVETSGSGKVDGGHGAVGEADLSADYDSVDGLTESVSINKKRVDLSAVRSKFSGRPISGGTLQALKLKENDMLTFVYETVYNSGPVTIVKKDKKDGCFSASFHKLANVVFKGKSKEDTTFTVPEKSTFAFSLVEVLLRDGAMEIALESWSHKRRGLSHDAVNCDLIEQARDGIEMKEVLLQPLEELPVSTRRDLLKGLQDVLEEGEALSLLEETLDQSSKGQTERPPSKVVSSFMDVLDESKVSSKVRDAVHLLVCAMDALPEIMLQPLTSCSPETLTALTQLVDSLKDGDEPSLPACPPVPLQQDGELRWAADVLCGSSETLVELSAAWDRRPEVLLEVLALAVLGVHRLQSEE
ncbi:PREDICTED: uncharacterized protein LOC106908265 [Poecilia mexicana]|uniref:uncharacterized protein LOC106908265 n=1 Tax=Poecilia mexicana TaxID=48701 RepID=UPI00072E62C0|nr:PREDICTED: uncharacterized protein LOC106908265 [Poecilia mexicana]XP_014829805.1 PREDICTED: uncharacterized protein LOC106908265 [Poecilia mexicana]XP_014829806.1 PREDICTED: uncharacterized protein LOC106908265 [Poecilia mexicana]